MSSGCLVRASNEIFSISHKLLSIILAHCVLLGSCFVRRSLDSTTGSAVPVVGLFANLTVSQLRRAIELFSLVRCPLCLSLARQLSAGGNQLIAGAGVYSGVGSFNFD